MNAQRRLLFYGNYGDRQSHSTCTHLPNTCSAPLAPLVSLRGAALFLTWSFVFPFLTMGFVSLLFSPVSSGCLRSSVIMLIKENANVREYSLFKDLMQPPTFLITLLLKELKLPDYKKKIYLLFFKYFFSMGPGVLDIFFKKSH